MMNAMPDIPRIYTAIAEWAACLIFILMLRPRYDKKRTVVIACGWLALQMLFLEITANIILWLWLPCMIVAFGLMIGMLYCCCKITEREAGYYGIFAFVIAEGMASLEWQIFNFFFVGGEAGWWIKALFLIIIYGGFVFILWNLIHRHIPQDGCLDINRKDWMSALLIGVVVFGFSNLSFVTPDTPFSGEYSQEIANIRTLVDIAGIAMLYAHMVLCCQNKVRMFFRHKPQARLRTGKQAFPQHSAGTHGNLRLQHVIPGPLRVSRRGQKSLHTFALVWLHLMVYKHAAKKPRQYYNRG